MPVELTQEDRQTIASLLRDILALLWDGEETAPQADPPPAKAGRIRVVK